MSGLIKGIVPSALMRWLDFVHFAPGIRPRSCRGLFNLFNFMRDFARGNEKSLRVLFLGPGAVCVTDSHHTTHPPPVFRPSRRPTHPTPRARRSLPTAHPPSVTEK